MIAVARRNLLFLSFLCYSHDIADVACKCCDACMLSCPCGNCYFFNCTIHVCNQINYCVYVLIIVTFMLISIFFFSLQEVDITIKGQWYLTKI